jgi:hypothetical protein
MTKKIISILVLLFSAAYSAALWDHVDAAGAPVAASSTRVAAHTPLKIVVAFKKETGCYLYQISLNGRKITTLVRSEEVVLSRQKILDLLLDSRLMTAEEVRNIQAALDIAKNPKLIKQEYAERLGLLTAHHKIDYPIWPGKFGLNDTAKKIEALYDLYYNIARRRELIEQRLLSLVTINRAYQQQAPSTSKDYSNVEHSGATIFGRGLARS